MIKGFLCLGGLVWDRSMGFTLICNKHDAVGTLGKVTMLNHYPVPAVGFCLSAPRIVAAVFSNPPLLFRPSLLLQLCQSGLVQPTSPGPVTRPVGTMLKIPKREMQPVKWTVYGSDLQNSRQSEPPFFCCPSLKWPPGPRQVTSATLFGNIIRELPSAF